MFNDAILMYRCRHVDVQNHTEFQYMNIDILTFFSGMFPGEKGNEFLHLLIKFTFVSHWKEFA